MVNERIFLNFSGNVLKDGRNSKQFFFLFWDLIIFGVTGDESAIRCGRAEGT